MAYEGWAHYDGCAVCPYCNAFIPVEGDTIPDILRTIDAHTCEASSVQARAGLASGTGGASQG